MAPVGDKPSSGARRPEEWDVIDGAICFPSSSAATHEQPGTSRAVCVMGWGGRRKKGEGSTKEEKKRFFMSESAMNLTCFPDLIYVNSTCSLRDKAFNTSDRNFMPYLL